MRLRYLATVALGAALSALPLPAQSAGEQLQKGIYAQETAGDLDGAIRIYRQVIVSNPAQRVFAAQAQRHLAQALLQKGDLAGAAQEFNTLAATYPEFHDLIADMAGRMQASGRARAFLSAPRTCPRETPTITGTTGRESNSPRPRNGPSKGTTNLPAGARWSGSRAQTSRRILWRSG